MTTTSVFTNVRAQTVSLPVEERPPEGVTQVHVRANERERIIAPLNATWDSFFLQGPEVSDDFMQERGDQTQSAREQL